jgi:hypothetical protein
VGSAEASVRSDSTGDTKVAYTCIKPKEAGGKRELNKLYQMPKLF